MRLRISDHAISRFRTRVEPLSHDAAGQFIADLLKDARIRPTPPHWMRHGTRYAKGRDSRTRHARHMSA